MTKAEKCRNTQNGRKVIHRGDEEKRVYVEDLDFYINEGWELGFSEQHRKSSSKARFGKEPWNKGTVGKMLPNSTSFKKGREPWNKGKKGVQKSTRKGLTKETSPIVYKNSIALKESWKGDDLRRKAQSERGKLNKGRHRSPEVLQQFLEKEDKTKSANHTFNTSKPEDMLYKRLCDIYGSENVIRNYRDKLRYNYRCDFYITVEDLFIECNLHWTHGFKPFDSDDEECQNRLQEWQEKAKVSQFYKNAIYTWTVRDTEKLRTAKKNNLKYITIYSLKL